MKRLLQIIFPLIGISLWLYILSVSISGNGGLQATFTFDKSDLLTYRLLRLAALTAFTLVSFQILTGPYMRLWEKLYGPRFYVYHGLQGIAALVFAVTHWILIHVYMYIVGLSIPQFDALYPKPYIWFGPIALVLLATTVIIATLTVFFKWTKLERVWWIHFANYAIFFLVFVHSINIGTDVSDPSSPLRPIWYFFFVGAVVGLIYRRLYVPFMNKQKVYNG